MRRNPLTRTVLFGLLALLGGFQLFGLTAALVTASRPRVTDFGLAGPGFGTDSDLRRLRGKGGLPIDTIWGPGPEAGLAKGDVITHIDGVSMLDHPGRWFEARYSARPGVTLHLTVRRGDSTLEVPLVTRRLVVRPRWPVNPDRDEPTMSYQFLPWWNCGPELLIALSMFAIGVLLGALRRQDANAWTFALVFIGISLGVSIPSEAPLLHLWPPSLLQFWRMCAVGSAGFAMPLSLVGLLRFPVPTPLSRRLWPWRWVPFVLFGVPALVILWTLIATYSGRAESVRGVAGPAYAALHGALAFGFAAMGVLLAAHRFNAPAARGRARMRVLWYGALGVVIGGLWSQLVPETFWFWLCQPLGPWGAWLARFLDDVAPALLVCLAPLSFAYAILARRLFGIRLVLRRGLQHLLLSRAVLAVEGVLLFLVLEQSIRRGAHVAGVSGPALAGGLALLVVSGLAAVNRPLMQALDRRFFRDRYDARRVMLGLAQELARLGERDEILRRIGEAIRAALHPSRVGIFLAHEHAAVFAAAWRSGPAPEGPAATAEAIAITAALRAAPGRPWVEGPPQAEPDEDGDPLGRDPLEARGAGERPAAWELLIPLRSSQRMSGCIALAAKLSEEPYGAEDRELLVTVAHQAALALENSDLLAVARREAQFAREVEIARDVQRNLFPRELPQIAGWEVAAICRPARAVAGDYYDVLVAADGALGVALGDVSGKGVGASLLSAGLHAMIRSRLPGEGCDLARLLADLNTHLLGSSAAEMFATIVVARIDPRAGRVTYVNAGHPPPLLVTGAGTRWLDQGGPLAGVVPDARYVTGELRMQPGDLFVIYSDGVTEAERSSGPARELFGDRRLLEALVEVRDGSADGALEAVLRAVDRWAGPGDPADDISVIVVKRLA